jgi:DNA adenine methylase
LIELYQGLKANPKEIWNIFTDFPHTKRGYYQIRSRNIDQRSLSYRAARVLYLNRTCFKGMWRYNQDGEFNVGYGGQDRRQVITLDNLLEVSKRLQKASLLNCDFEAIIDNTRRGDFIFLDPPYSPNLRETRDYHYNGHKFTFEDHKRLSRTLKRASRRGIKWALTTSSHPDILELFNSFNKQKFLLGSSEKIGVLVENNGGEVLINNYSKI